MTAGDGWEAGRDDLATDDPGVSLDDWIARLRLELAMAASGSDEQREVLAELASALAERHELADADAPHTADLDEAIDYLSALWSSLPMDDSDRAVIVVRLGLALGSRVLLYARHGFPPPGMDHAVDVLTEAEPGLREDRELHDVVVAMLGLVLGARFLFRFETGAASVEDRDGAVRWLERTLAGSPTDNELLAMCRQLLGRLLVSRAVPHPPPPGTVQLSEPALTDLDQAIGHLSSAVDAPVDDQAFHGATLALLGQALLLRGANGLGAVERDRAIDCLDGARQRLPEALAGSGELVALLGMLLGARARGRHARPSDLDTADEALGAAERLLPPGHVLQAAVLRERGLVLMLKGKRDHSIEDLSRAVACLTAAADLLPAEDPQRLDTLGVLGTVFVGAMTIGTLPTPISRAVELLRDALSPPPADPARHAMFRWSLGMAMAVQGVQRRQGHDLEAALQQMTTAAALLPPDHEIHLNALLGRALVLVDRFAVRGEAHDLDAAAAQLEELDRLLADRDPATVGPDQLDRVTVRAVLGDVRLRQATHRRELNQLGGPAAAAVQDLRAGLDGLAGADPMRARMQSELGMAMLGQGIFRQDAEAIRTGVDQLVAAARAAPQGHSDQAVLLGRAGYALVSYGELHQDPGALDEGIALLAKGLATASFSPGDRAGHLFGLGQALIGRYRTRQGRRDLDVGIGHLEEARSVLEAQPASPMTATVLTELAEAYRTRSDRDDPGRSFETARAALREHARNVLLQTGAERGLALARAASEEVVKSAMWCLADGQPDLAVEALETGRGLVLHAATVAVDVPILLREAGHNSLAAEWEAAGASAIEQPWDLRFLDLEGFLAGPPPEVPSDLRSRALAVLDGSQAIDRLLSPPTVPEIASALRAGGTDALVYLLPRHEHAPGRAVVVSSSGKVTELSLYLLHTESGGQAAAYLAAQREALAEHQDGEQERAVAHWRAVLGELCDWAWEAAVAPLLDHVAGWRLGRPPRLTLVPVGALGAVPWHAARSRQGMHGDRYRHACQVAVFSYAASARQLVEAGRRRRRPLRSAPVIVANPTGDLPATMLEARTLAERYYPGAKYLGRPVKLATGSGTPEEVLAALPTAERSGASMLHLGCHARADGSSVSTRLDLAGQPLSVARILRQAHNRAAEAPGGLVVLAACTSDLTDRDHDEALTLATTFLAAGAVSVVGSRWEVDDARTALLMIMFHHFLDGGEVPPADALRAAQLWMLDPTRVVPASVPPVLADVACQSDLDDVLAWAGFTHHGQ